MSSGYCYAQLDESGFLVGVSILSGKITGANYRPVTMELYQSLFDDYYKPRYISGTWVEGATQEEIDAIENPPEPIDLEAENAALWYEIMRKDAHDSEQDSEIATIWYELMTGGTA